MGGVGNWFLIVREVCMGPSRTRPLWAMLAGSGPAKAILPTWLKPAPRLAVPAQGEDGPGLNPPRASPAVWIEIFPRSEEHTSELQSRLHLVCRLPLEK